MNLSRDTAESSNELLYVGFNQDSGCFACGTKTGFSIFNVDPFRESMRRVFTSGGIGIVEMLFRCNLIAIVGGGRNPRYPTNKVMIWDDLQDKCIGELMFKSEVLAVKMRRDRIVVVLMTKVYVHRFSDLKLLDQIATLPNSKGLISLCPDASNNVLAVPGLAKGSIRIELYDIAKATIIKAHDAELAQFALSADGSRIASASEKGTLIRLWDCHTGDPLREFRRGMDRAEIYCIAFNTATTFIACSSDKGTVHIFSLLDTHKGAPDDISSRGESDSTASGYSEVPTASPGDASAGQGGNKSLGMQFLRGVLPPAIIPRYMNSEWSFAQVRGLEARALCAFDRDAMRIVVVSADGTFLVSSFEEGGECQRMSIARFAQGDDGDGRGDGLLALK